jgi:hypothetical protein
MAPRVQSTPGCLVGLADGGPHAHDVETSLLRAAELAFGALEARRGLVACPGLEALALDANQMPLDPPLQLL